MLTTIWELRTEMLERAAGNAPEAVAAPPTERLPAQSLLIAPRPQTVHLADIGEKRRALAA
jgi:hypothetical protein